MHWIGRACVFCTHPYVFQDSTGMGAEHTAGWQEVGQVAEQGRASVADGWGIVSFPVLRDRHHSAQLILSPSIQLEITLLLEETEAELLY